eukprot:CAMPEP_0195252628 /NCGR_PEP_ID=MMETSP0706-20130129/3973_1 /TAXON_ID=33640 /ORGANISM="Asterionellopsis glacialis, Strain CCMP134" /LENGTH=214 /DNA_ID=CAMNT_0040304955 /DNA_START=54 /DNA_END=698 /DNA_ORIENTATION=+
MTKATLSLLLLAGFFHPTTEAFTASQNLSNRPFFLSSCSKRWLSVLRSSSDGVIDLDDGDFEEVVEPGKMRVAEIKAELSMRGIKFDDCFDKESMCERLEEARASGKADPKILDEFNKKKLEENFSGKKLELNDDDVEKVVANDGTLPGGMSPDELQKLMSNPEIMTLLQSTKMQEAMKLMMTGGREDLEKAMAADPEIREVVQKLNQVMGGVM